MITSQAQSTYNFTNCTRCGKKRVFLKTWKEELETYSGVSVLTHTETICPDKDCQKIVEKELEAKRVKNETMKAEREERVMKQRAQISSKKAK
ncbi:MAG: hypothetical protein COX79_03155 [Candidatus Levybacteria bacterium CG_4_10_14_0_2_um_filter_36_16]|nr:MAG: hypothetical protein AUK12_05355 [Candidatus Levybacteria bacterium CG2_30_37_29]PIR79027.1 MAG: hypothetical protein COU26_03310 [Candidatus Levybacteria bacterium CG10_big_fil_rev_8_21_14_0_10_36_30]PIZ97162.1 MAG: hypothetical protein COX79_03155 [Candidatus Levybacteria bacterium CG_4_10_14_0_2_um_filter_36_16]PJA90018.1 MAG: hypothetical protein CO136_03390 [Candidatus Levybacteria bacterium CG_4_9_14_3_um_filter_36_7]